MRASRQDGTYPRPQLVRQHWLDLDGPWDFAHDDADVGLAERWWTGDAEAFDRQVLVPYPPESPASGIADPGFHPVVWYRRRVPHDDLTRAGSGARTLLHFGAVDHQARVWVDGALVAEHVGGQTPFTADVTEALAEGVEDHVIVVRAEDDPADVDVPRGKQDWRADQHGIWYDRTTGIWQSVWVEVVGPDHVRDLAWSADVGAARLSGEITLSRRPPDQTWLEVRVHHDEELLAEHHVLATTPVVRLDLALPALRNAQDRDRLLWRPERPVLLDVRVEVRNRERDLVLDTVDSYAGLRSVGVGDGAFLLNGLPYRLRSVLDQGFRPETHLAARDSEELRQEVRMILDLGFNAVRVHQKAEDPRFLYWADRLGLLVWGETAAAYAFSPQAVAALTTQWLDLVRRDRSHPSVVTWVPINESWGVHEVAEDPAQQAFCRAIAALTRAVDPSRPVMSNEGWEHVDSDILGVHDYTGDPDELRERYAAPDAARRLREGGRGPAGRRLVVGDGVAEGAPLMVTEFGGVSLSADPRTWGYTTARTEAEYAERLRGLFEALRAAPSVAGFCYTQYMDTGLETNGLLTVDGKPKLPVSMIREIVTGTIELPPVPDDVADVAADDPAEDAAEDAAEEPEGVDAR